MGKLLSGTMAIPSILTLVVLVMMVAFQGYCLIAYALGLIAFIWFVAFLMYQRQKVSITVLSYDASPKSDDGLRITFDGFIECRHPDGLKDIELWLHPNGSFSSLEKLSNVPGSVDSKPCRFSVTFDVMYSFIDQMMREQQTDGTSIAYMLSANMRSADWLYTDGKIPIATLRTRGVKSLGSRGRATKMTKRLKEERGTSQEQLYKLLNKASQPIKKSAQEKS